MKKIVSVFLLLTLVFSFSASCFAATEPLIEPEKKPILRIGGGPSPSAVWEVEDEYREEFQYFQVKKMSAKIQGAIGSTKYKAGKFAYDASIVAASFMGYGSGAVATSAQGLFGKSFFSEIQASANSLALATAENSSGDIITLNVTKYHRPASGETIYIYNY